MENKKRKHIIWSSYWAFDDGAVEEIMTEEGCEEITARDILWDEVQNDLEDERVNLDIRLAGDIFVFGSLGLWNGRRSGVKALGSRNLKDCLEFFKDDDYCEWYVEGKDLKAEGSHHDGTNHYIYRSMREGVEEDDFWDAFYSGMDRECLMQKYTDPIGPRVAEVYGWELAEGTTVHIVEPWIPPVPAMDF